MASNWQVVVEPEGRNPGPAREGEPDDAEGVNEGGMVVYIKGGDFGRREVSRVAWARRNSRNPDVPFEEQLRAEVEKAKQGIAVMDELMADAGELV